MQIFIICGLIVISIISLYVIFKPRKPKKTSVNLDPYSVQVWSICDEPTELERATKYFKIVNR